jgi:cysteinyl-tRNA synthetase
MPAAIQVLWKLVRDEKASGKIRAIKEMDKVFSLDLLKVESFEIPVEIKKLVDERENARKSKNFAKSDELRDKIKKLGFNVNDTKDGVKVSKI